MAAGPVPSGTEVLVTVRPERIEPGDGRGEADNTVDGELEETIFAGDVIKYAVRVPAGARLLVTVLSRDPARSRRRGERVRLCRYRWVPTMAIRRRRSRARRSSALYVAMP
jgi:TOBE domain